MRRILALIALGSALVLVGCHPSREPSSPQHDSPVFASEEAAAQAAQAVLARYVAAANRMAQSGGTDMSGYGDILSDFQMADEEKDAEEFRTERKHLVGDFSTWGFHVEQYVEDSGGAAMHARMCLDISKVRSVDSNGNDLTAESHVLAIPQQVYFNSRDDRGGFIIKEVSDWVGEDFCSSGSFLP